MIYRQQSKVEGSNHFGSRLVFARDGSLFITQGDRFTYRDGAHDLSVSFGKIVPINPDGSVPRHNPFVGRDGAQPAIWSYGHRNMLLWIPAVASNDGTGLALHIRSPYAPVLDHWPLHHRNDWDYRTEGVMITYIGLRHRVLGKLSTEADVSDCERALYGIAYAAVSGGAEGVTLDLLTSDRNWPLVEHAMTESEERFADEIAELRRLLAVDSRPVAERAAALWQEFIGAPLP